MPAVEPGEILVRYCGPADKSGRRPFDTFWRRGEATRAQCYRAFTKELFERWRAEGFVIREEGV